MLIAVDTGGTKTLVGRFSDTGILEQTVKFATPKSIPRYLTELRIAIAKLAEDSTITTISVGLPGRVREDGELAGGGNVSWHNVNFKQLLAQYYDCRILIENDANLAGLAETRVLKKAPRISLYITLSTGIGTGVIADGVIDKNLSQSEGGHAMLEYDGVIRDWETFASGAAIYKTYGKYARDITSKRVWHQIADRISRGLLAQVPLLQPEVIIIGGSIGTYFDHYGAELEQLLDEKLPPRIILRPKILQASHPEEAVIYGCYYHALDQAVA